jgi:hypothetical protein
MKNTTDKKPQLKELAGELTDNTENTPAEDLTELQQFIRKQRLQNKILKKLTEELQSAPLIDELKKTKSA